MDKIVCYSKPDIIPDQYSVISVVAFLMKKSYKSSKKYSNGLEMMLSVVNKLPSSDKIFLYVYHDITIEKPIHESQEVNNEVINTWIPLLQKLKDSPRVFCFRYNYPEFIVDKFYHVSTFGMMVRFMPFFDIPENKNIYATVTADIDLKSEGTVYRNINRLKVLRNTDIDVYITHSYCADQVYWLNIKRINKLTKIRLSGSKFTSKRKFPYSYLTEFFSEVKNDKHTELKNNIAKYRSTHKTNVEDKFGYGYDEYFLNKYFLYDIIKKSYIILNTVAFKSDFMLLPLFGIINEYTKKGFEMNAKQKELIKKLIPTYDYSIPFYDNINKSGADFSDKKFVERFLKCIVEFGKKDNLKYLNIDESRYICAKRVISLFQEYGLDGTLITKLKYVNDKPVILDFKVEKK